MEKEFLVEELDRGIAIHTKTEAEANRLAKLFSDEGLKWVDGDSFLEDPDWDNYEEQTAYLVSKLQSTKSSISYGDVSHYTKLGATIIDSTQIVKTKSNNNINKPTKMKEQITLFRRGFFVTENFTPTQCTTEGHESYTYSATLRCGYQLDEQGFLIDHTLLHKAVVAYIKDKPMLSCEVMSKQLAHLVVDAANGHGCQLKEIDFTIIPVDRDQIQQQGDGEWVAKKPMKINYNRPANAIYNLIVDEEYKSVISDEDKAKYITSAPSTLIPVTKENAFIGMRVIKGKYWRDSRNKIEDGDIGTIIRHSSYFPIDAGEPDVRVRWDKSGNNGDGYYIVEGREELYLAPNSPTKEEYIASRPTPVTKENAVIGLRVIKGEHWSDSNDDIEDGEVGTIVKGKKYFPQNSSSDYVVVNWDESGVLGDSYRIREENAELAVSPVPQYGGQIADFPTEVVQKMLEYQKEQGNEEYGVEVFEELKTAGSRGFSWSRTREGSDFWGDVIDNKNFDRFFEVFKQ